MRVSVDSWDPSYGTAGDGDGGEPGGATVNLAVERAPARWAPVRPPPAEASCGPEVLVFVDGVRRVEARVWVEPDGGDGGELAPGLCASWAAGAMRCDGHAELVAAAVGRGLFTPSPHVADLVTAHGRFVACPTAGATPEALSLALQERMTASEVAVAAGANAAGAEANGAGLLVIDGPLRGRQHLNGAVGLVKSHQVDYLGPELRPVRRGLRAGERTPIFTIGTTWSRHSWYLRLPGALGNGPMAGIVRLECAATLAPPDAVALADATALALPRFASAPAKEARAPQNLFPIAALERELRRRLGDPQLLYRSLLAAA